MSERRKERGRREEKGEGKGPRDEGTKGRGENSSVERGGDGLPPTVEPRCGGSQPTSLTGLGHSYSCVVDQSPLAGAGCSLEASLLDKPRSHGRSCWAPRLAVN